MANALTELFLNRRGYSYQYMQRIDDAQHQKLKNIEQMVSVLHGIHERHEKIVIMPDFDTDGIDAGVIGFAGLSELGFNVGLYRPDPTNGYGIKVEDIQKVLQQFPDAKYIISCDVGITCYDAFFYAYQHGLKVLVTDHHEEMEVKKPAEYTENGQTIIGPKKLMCECKVDPCLLDETYKLRDICGAFVFWQILTEYARVYANILTQDQISMLCLFAGMGTIGDMEPLVHENRDVVKKAISMMRFIYDDDQPAIMKSIQGSEPFKAAFRGFYYLLDALKHDKKLMHSDDLDEKYMAWTLSPMFNSIKRMGESMDIIFGLFLADADTQQQLAQKVLAINEQRKIKVAEYYQAVIDSKKNKQQPYDPFIFFSKAPGRIIGLLANKIEEDTHLPTFAINEETLAGSGRSYSYFPVIDELKDTEFTVMGHQQAFGIQFKDHAQIKRFYDYLNQNVLPKAIKYNSQVKDDCDLTLALEEDDGRYDFLLNVEQASQFHQDMLNLRPFGAGFAVPKVRILFNTQNVRMVTMGSEKQHLKIILPNGLQLISWKNAKLLDTIQKQKVASFTGDFDFNFFNGQRNLQLIGNPELKKEGESKDDQ